MFQVEYEGGSRWCGCIEQRPCSYIQLISSRSRLDPLPWHVVSILSMHRKVGPGVQVAEEGERYKIKESRMEDRAQMELDVVEEYGF